MPEASTKSEPSSPTPHLRQEMEDRVRDATSWVDRVREEMARVIVGQEIMVDRLIIGLLTNGHILLEGVPGLAKTLMVSSLAGCLKASFHRFQFTPDLLPADLVGTMIYNPAESEFKAKLGPIFANLILADEINRAPAKVQSALLQAMQEREVSIGDSAYPLPDPFLVLATQNPIDQEGTYSLPEAQLDRFLFKVVVNYPSKSEEKSILNAMASTGAKPQTRPIIDPGTVASCREVVNDIFIDERLKDYIVEIVHATRAPGDIRKDLGNYVRCGASPRGSISLTIAAKALAFLNGIPYVTPQLIKTIAPDVLRHRVLLTYEAQAQGITTEQILDEILANLPVP